MERLMKDEAITLDDDKEYYIVDVVEQDGHRYLYLVNEPEVLVVVAEEIIDGDEIIVEMLDDQEKVSEIVKIVLERLSKN